MNYSEEKFDAIIIGSGLGGATTAYQLAQKNQKVLVIEKGQNVKRDDLDWDPKEILVKERYKSKEYDYVTQYEKPKQKFFFNEMVGGQTVLYGGAAFRLKKKDFDGWPVKYDEFEPYYGKAENLLNVHGQNQNPHDDDRSSDFPAEAIDFSKPAQRIINAAQKLGLNPFKIPLAIDFKKCELCNTCDGFPCKVRAKGDAQIGILDKAIERGALLYSNAVAIKIVHQNNHASGVIVYDRAQAKNITIYANKIIVAGGAIHSSALLLHSEINKGTPSGHYIGKYLMRHCNAAIGGLFPFKTNPDQVFHKQVVISDFYEDQREKDARAVGVIQDIYTPSNDVLRAFLPPIIKVGSFFGSYIQNLLCIAEEEPHAKNEVLLTNSNQESGFPRLHIKHSYTKEDYARRNYLLGKAKKILRRAGALICQTYKIETFSHAVGTARFGDDKNNSALDRNCKIHNFDNLYVIDGSFMPTSAGVNPSLTIVANALRVSDHLLRDEK